MTATIQRFDPQAEFYTGEKCFINELSNTPDDPDVSIARARVQPGKTTRWHRLVGTTERYVILEGTGRVELGSHPPQEVMAGDVVLIPPMMPQRIANTGSGDLIFLAVCTPRFRPGSYQDMEKSPSRQTSNSD